MEPLRLSRSLRTARPALAQIPRRIRAHDPNDEVDRQENETDLGREPQQRNEQRHGDAKNAEKKLERDHAQNGEQPDRENGAEHERTLQNVVMTSPALYLTPDRI